MIHNRIYIRLRILDLEMSANNIFVSYKYHDHDVKPLDGNKNTVARDYVDYIENIFSASKKVYYRGEKDGDDMSNLSEETIHQRLSDKIFYTSVTVVLISPNMYDQSLPENRQWIPWEISYSLKENNRESGRSHMNAVLAVVLPDRNGRCDYALEEHGCHRTIRTDRFFPIIGKNMFNIKRPDIITCECGCQIYSGTCGYIPLVTWEIFVEDHYNCIQIALKNKDNQGLFSICKKLEG